MKESYSFKTTPMSHQYEAFMLSADKEYFALLMEQGTGKTKVTLDTAAYNYNMGRINCMVVIAPNGVHLNWVLEECGKHLPDYIQWRAAAWNATMKKEQQRALDRALEPGDFLRIITINVEAMHVERAHAFLKKVLTVTNAMLVVDESQKIKNPQSERTKRIMKLRNLTKMRRVLTGTPITQGPLDTFAQYTFLSEDILPTKSFVSFRARYAEILPQDSPLVQNIRRKTGKAYGPQLIATDRDGQPIYKNLDELRELTAAHSFRVLKKDCLDLPEKIYKRRFVELHDIQARALRDLRDRVKMGVMTEDEEQKPISKLNAVMYYQQILSGRLPAALSPTGAPERLFSPSSNPRIRALLSELEETDEKALIWCRFTDDILDIAEVLREEYGPESVVLYYGDVSKEDRLEALRKLQHGDARFFIANPSAGGTGLTLTAATQAHYYSNSFKLEDRLQSEDRNHRIGTTRGILYTDYEVPGTVDTRIITALRDKKDVADLILGDDVSTWMTV